MKKLFNKKIGREMFPKIETLSKKYESNNEEKKNNFLRKRRDKDLNFELVCYVRGKIHHFWKLEMLNKRKKLFLQDFFIPSEKT